jgi:hypothetical protein
MVFEQTYHLIKINSPLISKTHNYNWAASFTWKVPPKQDNAVASLVESQGYIIQEIHVQI